MTFKTRTELLKLRMATRMLSQNHLTVFLIIIAASAAASTTSSEKYLKVDFTVQLNVETLTSSSYTTFLKDLRRKLAASYSRNVPVLPLYNEADPHGFDIVLKTSTREVPTRFRADNLYLVGYQMQKPKLQWMEFGTKATDPHLIPNSQFLGFGDRYGDMEKVAETSVDRISLNKQAFLDAVLKLADSTVPKERAKALILVAQMLAETSRFVDISDYLASKLSSSSSVFLPTWMRTLENDWGRFSTIVLYADAFPCYAYKPQTINGVVMKTVADLRDKLGILLRDPDTLKPPCKMEYEQPSIIEFEAQDAGPANLPA